MQKNLVIVESPAKAKTISGFLGKNYDVLSSYGHIRDLKKKDFSIDTTTFLPQYVIPTDKKKVVSELKAHAKKADIIWLASDEDREGEAISWHLSEVLKLTKENSRRIVFHEITKDAIKKAIETPRTIDQDLVNAQQTRRVLDRIVGFKLSPVLWKRIKPSLSAGRVQSVTVRLMVEREREINAFKATSSYRILAYFDVPEKSGKVVTLKSELNNKFKTKEEAKAFLESCKGATFTIQNINKRPQKRNPTPPFTTSTLQQEAVRKLGYSVSKTMMLAQRLYEAGLITYMRTDSLNLSQLFLNACKPYIAETMGEKYSKERHYHTKAKGAQEAHEAIRPTDITKFKAGSNNQEERLYNLIWKRTIASQMTEATIEKTTVKVGINGHDQLFVANGEVVKFDGFLRVYRESFDEEEDDDTSKLLPPMQEGQNLNLQEITATERFSQHPPRYTEATLVHKLEELGIGRPSTYAPTISVIQQRQYVEKNDCEGTERSYQLLTLKDNNIEEVINTENVGYERMKLIPTDIGMVVNDFLLQSFPNILDYNFTAKVEKEFDDVADGKIEWTKLLRDFYNELEPQIEKVLAKKNEKKVGERVLGIHPKTGRPISVKIGRFGPVAQMGLASDEEKPVFASLRKGQSMETITFEEVIELFKLPRKLGEYEGYTVSVNVGRFGPYVLHNKKYCSITEDIDPLEIELDKAIDLIEKKKKQDAEKQLKTFEEDSEMEILNGRYGPYIYYKKANYRLPKDKHATAKDLTFAECQEIIKEADAKPKRRVPKRNKK